MLWLILLVIVLLFTYFFLNRAFSPKHVKITGKHVLVSAWLFPLDIHIFRTEIFRTSCLISRVIMNVKSDRLDSLPVPVTLLISVFIELSKCC